MKDASDGTDKQKTIWVEEKVLDFCQRVAVQILGMRGWRRRTGGREDWRSFLKEVRTQKGLLRRTWMD
jgi:hypothetical protein